VNGHRAVRARDPNLALDAWADVRTSAGKIRENLARSFHTMKSVSETGSNGGKSIQKITAAPDALDRLAGLSPDQRKDVADRLRPVRLLAGGRIRRCRMDQRGSGATKTVTFRLADVIAL